MGKTFDRSKNDTVDAKLQHLENRPMKFSVSVLASFVRIPLQFGRLPEDLGSPCFNAAVHTAMLFIPKSDIAVVYVFHAKYFRCS